MLKILRTLKSRFATRILFERFRSKIVFLLIPAPKLQHADKRILIFAPCQHYRT